MITESDPQHLQIPPVSSVADGDTIEVQPAVNGKTDVRLIGVDTPETYGGEEPLGAEAKQFTTNRLEGRQVKLVLGQDPEDPYGRLLANVVPIGQQRMHAELLLERGLALMWTFYLKVY